MSHGESVYKIFTLKEWEMFQAEKVFNGSVVDKADGFIHMSTHSQMQETLDKHYTSGKDVIVAEIDLARLNAVKWEVSRGGAKFPHQYGELTIEDVMSSVTLCADVNGRYAFAPNT